MFCRKRRDSFASIDSLLELLAAERDRSNDCNAGPVLIGSARRDAVSAGKRTPLAIEALF